MWHMLRNNKADSITKIPKDNVSHTTGKQPSANDVDAAKPPDEVSQMYADQVVEPSTSLISSAQVRNVQAGLETTLSVEENNHIQHILDSIENLTDVQKLLLYLKLPTGGANYANQPSVGHVPGRNDREQRALIWLRTHLDVNKKTCILKQTVYDEYKSFCMRHDYAFVNLVEFAKLVKFVFPQMNTRRLGQRGQSKHAFGALARKTVLDTPHLPDLKVEPPANEKPNTEGGSDVASCFVVCEWAQRLLGQNFTAISRLADYLVLNNCVSGRTLAAFSVLAARQKAHVSSAAGSSASYAAAATMTTTLQTASEITRRPEVPTRSRDVQLCLQRALQLRRQKTLLSGDSASQSPEIERPVQRITEKASEPSPKPFKPSPKPFKPSLPKLIYPKMTPVVNSPTSQPLLVFSGSNIQIVSNVPSNVQSNVQSASIVPTQARIPSRSVADEIAGQLTFVVQHPQQQQMDGAMGNSSMSQVAVNQLSESSQNIMPSIIEQHSLQTGQPTLHQLEELYKNITENLADIGGNPQQELTAQMGSNDLLLSPGPLLQHQTTVTPTNEMTQAGMASAQPQFVSNVTQGAVLSSILPHLLRGCKTDGPISTQAATMSPVFTHDGKQQLIHSPVFDNAMLQNWGNVPPNVVHSPTSGLHLQGAALQTKTGRPMSATVSALLRNKRGCRVVKPVEVCDMRPVSQLLSESRRARQIQFSEQYADTVTGVITTQGHLVSVNDNVGTTDSQGSTELQTVKGNECWAGVMPPQSGNSQQTSQDGSSSQMMFPGQVLPNDSESIAIPWPSRPYVPSNVSVQARPLYVQDAAQVPTPTYMPSPVSIQSAPHVPYSPSPMHGADPIQSPLLVQNAASLQLPLTFPTNAPLQPLYAPSAGTTASPLSISTNDGSPKKQLTGEISSTDESSSHSLSKADEGLSEMTWPTHGGTAEQCIFAMLSPESQQSCASTPLLSPRLLLQQPAGFTPIRPDADHTGSPLPHAQHTQHAQPATKHRGFVPYQRALPLGRQRFALASGIRPVKRGSVALPNAVTLLASRSKRMRRHSGQSSLQPKHITAMPVCTPLANHTILQLNNQTGQTGDHRQATHTNSVMVESHVDVNMADNISPDPLTFSPEIHDIISCSSGPRAADAQYRSHSVPAQLHSMPHTELQFTGDTDVSLEDLLDDIGEMYQRDKTIQEPFAARKNLSQFLTTPLTGAMRMGRGDHMISGASLRRSAWLFSNAQQSDNSAPTPPASHNNTPVEFADEITPDVTAPTLTQAGLSAVKPHWVLEEN